MTAGTPDRARQIALFVVGVAVVLLVSSVTWFGSDRAGWGIAQLVVAVLVGAAGAVMYRRAGGGRAR
ncbi:hypothetical protein JKP75_18415 [Blastococcus sp. TML/M2B]|uniref:hypothetical protein n=1 Tax=unclassified Blastococcus TaxID=2619396 RepID=UPI00190AA9E8|nr:MULTISPECIES: hypothetical protein [unclassified Blastococcus]MBN1094347.1 hypothetical protein [Blastococcus sp. TML/M2B]MBN1095531.1 hypothetical protein [Blastococcus sp. TML/C7B]